MAPLRLVAGVLFVVGMCAACSGLNEIDSKDTASSNETPENTVVARYADETITLTDLDSAYAASVGGRGNAADSSLSAYKTFLDQYVNFRLKVRAARDAGLDTLASVQRDISQYRQEMARPRLMRENVYEPVLRTLYDRQSKEVDVSHIMIRPTSETDTAEAYRTLQRVVDSLDRGVPFGELAYRNSEDPSAQKKGQRGYRGRLGYIQAGQVVEPFEKRMYSLKPGEVSNIFRTQYGYHILKVHDRRPTQPPVHLSHIMLQPEGDSSETHRVLDSLRTEILTGGASFERVAQEYSEDQQSAKKGGDLGSAKPQSLPDAFKRALARMDSVGAVSEVLNTRFGYHLVKLTGREEKKSFDEAYDKLKKQVSGQPRIKQQKKTFTHRVRKTEGVTVDTVRILDSADISAVDSLARPLLPIADKQAHTSPKVATIGDSTYTLHQLAHHLTQTDGGAQMTVAELIESFLNEKAFEYAGARLEERDPEFATEMKKYREGVLLFRYMQDSVWTAAAEDTAGLRRTFEKNRDEYRFPERIRTLVLRAPADSLLHPYSSMYGSSTSARAIVDASARDSLVSVDTVFVSDKSADVYQPIRSVSDGETVGPTEQRNDWLFMIRDKKLPPRRKTFEEARSSVIQDYQTIYEEQVIQNLRWRYDAKVYPERLRQPFGSPSSSS